MFRPTRITSSPLGDGSPAGDFSGDGINVETRWAYTDFQLPWTESKARISIGLIPFSVKKYVWQETLYDGSRLLLAVTEGSRIEVFEIGEKLAPLAAGGISRGGRIHALHWWRPSPGGPLLPAATIAVEENQAYSPAIGQTIVGRVFAMRGGMLEPVGRDVPYLLGSFDRDGDGIRETLLGQPFDRDIFFGTRIREVRLDGEELAIGDPSIPLPGTFPVQGAVFADLTGDGRPDTLFIRNHTLFVYDGTKLLYKSSRQMGGSLSVMTYDINPGQYRGSRGDHGVALLDAPAKEQPPSLSPAGGGGDGPIAERFRRPAR